MYKAEKEKCLRGYFNEINTTVIAMHLLFEKEF